MSFKQSEVERAVKAIEARGLPISVVTVDPHTGEIKIAIGPPDGTVGKSNPWDEKPPT
jgi:hypothetical protein